MKDYWLIGICFFIMAGLLFYGIRKKRQLSVSEKKKLCLEEQTAVLERELEEEKQQIKVLSEKMEDLKKQEEKSRKLAMTDHVTGLPNRMAFTEVLDGVLKTLRKDENVAVLHIDVDNFKKITETMGRSYGDELLIDVTDRIRQVMDDNDFFACLGGDEFWVLSQNIMEMGEYEEKVKKIRQVFSYPFVLAAREIFVTVSIGIAFAPKDGKTTQTIFKNLDSALFQAKSRGKNNYCYYEEEMNKNLMGQIELQAQIRSGIANGEFAVYYQPQVDLRDGKVSSFEALLRWNHPARGVLLPAEFLPTAEAAGLMVSIGKWMLSEICEQVKSWEKEGLGKVSVSMNLTGRQFEDSGLFAYVSELLENTGLDSGQLIMEVTEEIILEDLEQSIETMRRLKELGVGFSLDHFGTGYSSIKYLKQIPADQLKIDKLFLDQILEDEENGELLKAMIALAKAFHFRVIAQGVENETQESFLKHTECNIVQGFLYSEPMQPKAAGKLLRVMKNGGRIEDAIWL